MILLVLLKDFVVISEYICTASKSILDGGRRRHPTCQLLALSSVLVDIRLATDQQLCGNAAARLVS